MKSTKSDNKALLPIILLYIGAAAITAGGVFFTVYSLINGVMIPVLSSLIPGALFGAAVTFLGARYLVSVNKLHCSIIKSKSRFSWDNFRKRTNLN